MSVNGGYGHVLQTESLHRSQSWLWQGLSWTSLDSEGSIENRGIEVSSCFAWKKAYHVLHPHVCKALSLGADSYM